MVDASIAQNKAEEDGLLAVQIGANTWSWDDQVAAGRDNGEWDGVRNYRTNNMKAMKVGDKGFFYHSVNEKQIVGIVEVVMNTTPTQAMPPAS